MGVESLWSACLSGYEKRYVEEVALENFPFLSFPFLSPSP